ncbi:hypothetical protein D1AOALGA4SA_12687 [Olavius algarvensis Delta 1 endosymbiont]|nr:hypothetical protein D1AOALGA4SA_12687 [Olavius algarvensis Delta 1 endosymbiont]
MQKNRSDLHSRFPIIIFLLFIGLAYGVRLGCSASSNQEKASYASGRASSSIVKPPKIGDLITNEKALALCEQYNFDYLVKRIEDNPEHFKAWEFDGCSMTPTEVLSEIIKVPSLTEICLRHDLAYAYGEPGNEEERLRVDKQFQLELVDGGASESVAKTMFNAVRQGGREAFCLSFSWSFARVAPCKPGFGITASSINHYTWWTDIKKFFHRRVRRERREKLYFYLYFCDFSSACSAISSEAPRSGTQARAVKSCLNNYDLISRLEK